MKYIYSSDVGNACHSDKRGCTVVDTDGPLTPSEFLAFPFAIHLASDFFQWYLAMANVGKHMQRNHSER